MSVQHVKANNFLTKSERFNYTCNPYGGCSHNCVYCYAYYMSQYRKEYEPWGSYIDIKDFDSYKTPKDAREILLSTVTDPYQPIEKLELKTRKALEALIDFPYEVSILTKNKLVTRDIDLFKQIPNLKVGMSLCTVDEKFRSVMEPYTSTIEERLNALKTLHEAGIKTYVFICPIFPKLTNYKKIISLTKDYVDEYMFDFLNLRGGNRDKVLSLIKKHAPRIYPLYHQIYIEKDMTYLNQLRLEILDYIKEEKVVVKV